MVGVMSRGCGVGYSCAEGGGEEGCCCQGDGAFHGGVLRVRNHRRRFTTCGE